MRFEFLGIIILGFFEIFRLVSSQCLNGGTQINANEVWKFFSNFMQHLFSKKNYFD